MSNMTGSNAVLVHSARVYAAVLDKNASLAADAFTRIWGELYFSDGRKAGIKADGAFFQHCDPYGPGYLPLGKIGQLYSGGYGSDFSKAMLQWVGSVAGIKTFPLSEDNYQVLSALVLDGQVTLVTSSVAQYSLCSQVNCISGVDGGWKQSQLGCISNRQRGFPARPRHKLARIGVP